jgi:DNA-binding response OmpR family regulator
MRVVIIDDDEGIAFALRLALEDRGCEVVAYTDPSTVPYNEISADAFLVDFYMPKMDGEQVVHKLHDQPRLKDAIILLMSASPDLAQQAANLKVSYIAKPFDLDMLCRRLEVV